MSHESTPIEPLSNKATNAEIVAKINELIERINHMWYPESSTPE